MTLPLVSRLGVVSRTFARVSLATLAIIEGLYSIYAATHDLPVEAGHAAMIGVIAGLAASWIPKEARA